MKKEAYYTTKMQKDLVFKYCGYEKCTPDFIQYPHIRSEYLIHYVTKGRGYYHVLDKVYELTPGCLFLILPDTLVSYESSQEDPFVFSWFAFTGKRARAAAMSLGFSEAELVIKLHPQYSISKPIETLSEFINSPAPFNEFLVLELLYCIFSKIISSNQLNSAHTPSQENIVQDHIDKAKSYISFNYMNPISAQSVSNYVGLERSYFSKIFHRITGYTTQNFILETRIRHSRQLLETTNYNISKISYYVGITDVYYFSRAFKKIVGTSPSHYRERFLNQ